MKLTPAPIELATGISFARSGDILWAWDREWVGEGPVHRPTVAYYRNGAWGSLPPLRPTIRDVGGDPDAMVWAVTTPPAPVWIIEQAEDLPEEGHVLWVLEENDWRQVPAEVLGRNGPNGIEIDERDRAHRGIDVEVVRSDLSLGRASGDRQ